MKKTKTKVKNPIEQVLGAGLGSWDEIMGITSAKEKQKKPRRRSARRPRIKPQRYGRIQIQIQ